MNKSLIINTIKALLFSIILFFHPAVEVKAESFQSKTCTQINEIIRTNLSIKDLFLDSCQILESLDLIKLTNLKYLKIENCHLNSIANLGKLPSSLKVLSISNCNLKSLEGINDLPRGVKIIDLGSNQLKYIDLSVFPDSIVELFLNNNPLTSIVNVERLRKLGKLNLSNTLITNLPDKLNYCPIKHLILNELTRLKYEELGQELSDFKELEQLSLNRIPIKELPTTFKLSARKNLKLDLSNNPHFDFDRVFLQLSQCGNIHQLIFQNCFIPSKFTNFMEVNLKGIGILKNVEIIDLSYNQIKLLPAEIEEMTSLRSLYLNYNTTMDSFPNDLKSSSLEVLELNGLSGLKVLTQNFSQLPNLKRLTITRTQVKAIPSSLYNCTQLEVLELFANRGIKKLPLGLSKLKKLQKLNLNYDDIREIPEDLGKLLQLKYLGLKGNYITNPMKDKIKSYGLLKAVSY